MAGELLRAVSGEVQGPPLPIDGELVIGREGPAAALLAADLQISRSHARIHRTPDGRLVLEDLGSKNGTYLNGWRIPAPQYLNSADKLQLGGTVLELSAPATRAARRPAIISGVHGYEELRPPKAESVLYATGVKKSYGKLEVLKGVDLEVQPGEVVGLLGANGAGKTSFVSIVAGLRSADAGEIQIAGVDALRNSRAARRHLGIAPQDLGIYPTLSVRRNLTFFGEIAGLKGRELNERVEEVGTALSLDPLFDRPSGKLSGGQKRRLHTGMAMLHHPALLILDEPTVGADIRTRQEILEQVKRLAEEGRGVCYSTHYLPEIEFLGASVAILQGGEIIARGSIAELVAKHSSPFLELSFDGPAPDIGLGGQVAGDESLLRIKTDDPSGLAAAAMGRLGVDAVRLSNVEVIRPSLESVYLSLTEQRYSDAS